MGTIEDGQRDRILATAAHELRNPLAALDLELKLLQIGVEDIDPIHARMGRQLERLTSFANDLLEMSRLTYDKLELRKVSTDLVAVIQSVVEGVTTEIREKKQTLVLCLPERLHVEGDPARLAEVVSNLMSNASRYTPERGRIEVSAGRDRDGVVIGVRDTGVGLRQEDIETMFEPFVQSDATKGGLGIGLALVKGLVELHGGTVLGESEGPGQGCLFTVRLPFAEMGRTAPEARRGSIPRLSRHVRALIVDDHDGFADSLALVLGRMGAETLCAYSGADGIDKARMWYPDVVLVDLGLPDMTGFEVAQRVRSWEGAEAVRLIAVTGSAEQGSGRIARQAGFDGSLVKPIDIDRMHALLEQLGPPGASAAREPGALPDHRAEARGYGTSAKRTSISSS